MQDSGLDPRTPGSWPEPKAQLLSHPGTQPAYPFTQLVGLGPRGLLLCRQTCLWGATQSLGYISGTAKVTITGPVPGTTNPFLWKVGKKYNFPYFCKIFFFFLFQVSLGEETSLVQVLPISHLASQFRRAFQGQRVGGGLLVEGGWLLVPGSPHLVMVWFLVHQYLLWGFYSWGLTTLVLPLGSMLLWATENVWLHFLQPVLFPTAHEDSRILVTSHCEDLLTNWFILYLVPYQIWGSL